MKTVSLSELSKSDYNIKLLSYFTFIARPGKKYTCMTEPKAHNLLRYVNKSRTVYIDRYGDKIYASDGEVVYTPKGSRYEVETFDIKDGGTSMQLDFLIYDSDGNEVRLCDTDVLVFDRQKTDGIKPLFEKLGRLCEEESLPTEKKTVLFEILNHLGAGEEISNYNPIIKKGIVYLKAHYNENPSVAKLARMCAVSEEYFRRLFKKKFNMTPCEYRNKLRLAKACDYLTYGETGVEEISVLLGYSTVSHFSKEFKKAYGISPTKYRNGVTIEKK